MSMELDFFPVLTQYHLERIGLEVSQFNFGYMYEGEKRALETVPLEEHRHRSDYLKIVDEDCQWVPDLHDIFFTRTYTINNPRFLFGPGGLACEDAELGIALLWTSKTSNQRGVEVIAGFNKTNPALQVYFKSEFNKGQLRGHISLQTILFIKNTGNPQSGEEHLANQSGIVLGTLDEQIIYFDGNGSIFPIVEVSMPSQPLWWVSCEWSDPLTDSFTEENVKVCLNRAHVNYKFLSGEKNAADSAMLKEIIATALTLIIQKVKESVYWDEVISGQNIETGSIAQAVKYFMEIFDLDLSSPEKLALTLRANLDNRM